MTDAGERQQTRILSLGVKWSQVQILSARRTKPAPNSIGAHLLDEALSWHVRYLRDGTMKPT